MGNSSNLKQLRGQLRQLIKELLPEIIAEELMKTVQNKFKERLDSIDNNQKNLQSYILRHAMENSVKKDE